MKVENGLSETDERWMQYALDLAKQAALSNEVPVGAVLVLDQQILGYGFNQPISNNDPTAHAEIIALRQAAKKLNNYRLVNTTLYVTLEPCAMCAAAMLHARIQRLVFAATDPKAGAVGGAIDLFKSHSWNHTIQCQSGILAEPCAAILKQFFQQRR